MYWRQWSSSALSAFACPAVTTHPLRLCENHLYKYTARKAVKRHSRAVTGIPGPPTWR